MTLALLLFARSHLRLRARHGSSDWLYVAIFGKLLNQKSALLPPVECLFDRNIVHAGKRTVVELLDAKADVTWKDNRFWGGTLGLWPLSLLIVYGLVLFGRSLLAGQDTRMLFFWFAGAVLIAFFVAYWTLRLDLGAGPHFWPVVWQIIPTLLLFPAADWLIRRFDDADVGFR